jgi:hypothetical protein
MAGYLLYPRPEAWPKTLIAPLCFGFAASSTGDTGDAKNFLVLWVILECLLYPARYQWNDIRGIDADQEHSERDSRSRLPADATPASRRHAIQVSRATAVTRVLAALPGARGRPSRPSRTWRRCCATWTGRSWTANLARAGTAATTAYCGPARGCPRRGTWPWSPRPRAGP